MEQDGLFTSEIARTEGIFRSFVARGTSHSIAPGSCDAALCVPREAHLFADLKPLADRVALLPPHLAEVADWIWDRMRMLLSDPLSVWEIKGGRVVVALGGYGFCLVWNRPRVVVGAAILESVHFAQEIEEIAFPFRTSLLFQPLVQRILEPDADSTSDYPKRRAHEVLQACVRIHGVLRRTGVLRELGRCIRLAAGVNVNALRLAVQARRKGHPTVLTNGAYSFACQHQNLLGRVSTETPHLLPLVFYAWEAMRLKVIDIGVIGEVKKILKREGIPHRVWRILVEAKKGQLRAALDVVQASSSWEALVDYCHSLDKWGAEHLVPADMLRAIRSRDDPKPGGRVQLGGVVDPTAHWFVEAGLKEYWRRDRSRRADFIANEFLLVMNWEWSEMPNIDRNQRRAGWAWMLREARLRSEWNGLKSRLVLLGWKSPVQRFERDGLVAIALDSRLALWEEAQAQRHCVEDFGAQCIEGGALVYSIRDQTGKRIATTAFTGCGRRGVWAFESARGFANSIVGPRVDAFARWLLATVNQQGNVDAGSERGRLRRRVESRREQLPPDPQDPMRRPAEAIENWLEDMARTTLEQ